MPKVKLCFYVPSSHLEPVKQALFAAGAGKVGHYDCCAWQTRGTGQYRPLAGSSPFKGEAGKIEQVDEVKVEMICEKLHLPGAIQVLRQAHPYETPAFDVLPLLDIESL